LADIETFFDTAQQTGNTIVAIAVAVAAIGGQAYFKPFDRTAVEVVGISSMVLR